MPNLIINIALQSVCFSWYVVLPATLCCRLANVLKVGTLAVSPEFSGELNYSYASNLKYAPSGAPTCQAASTVCFLPGEGP